MKTRQEKIDAIYEKIARKDLSFGCKFLVKKEMSWGHITFEKGFKFDLIKSIKKGKYLYAGEDFGGPLYFTNFEFENLEIIGHPVMIGDVMEWIYDNEEEKFKNSGINNIFENLRKLWILNLRNPIEDQSDECVDFIYNLIK